MLKNYDKRSPKIKNNRRENVKGNCTPSLRIIYAKIKGNCSKEALKFKNNICENKKKLQ